MRTAASRRPGTSRVYSMKPVTFPMLFLLCHRYLLACNAKHAFVFVREHLDELGQHVLPVLEHPLAAHAVGGLHVAVYDPVEQVGVFRRHRLQIHPGGVAALGGEVALLIQHVSDATPPGWIWSRCRRKTP